MFYDYCQFMQGVRNSRGGSYKYRDVFSMTEPQDARHHGSGASEVSGADLRLRDSHRRTFGQETKAACRTVVKGDKGQLVRILKAGLLVHGIRETKIDAIFGDGTEEGVREFQRQAGITVDGMAGPRTFEELIE